MPHDCADETEGNHAHDDERLEVTTEGDGQQGVDSQSAHDEAIAEGAPERIPDCLSDKWLADTTLFGPPAKILEGLEAWYDAGIRTPILVPSSAAGNQLTAFQEMFELFE